MNASKALTLLSALAVSGAMHLTSPAIAYEASSAKSSLSTTNVSEPIQLAQLRIHYPPTRIYNRPVQMYRPPTRMYYPPVRLYEPSTRMYYPPLRLYEPPIRVYYPPTTPLYNPPTWLYYPPVRIYDPPAGVYIRF
jgi:hypothetical protein